MSTTFFFFIVPTLLYNRWGLDLLNKLHIHDKNYISLYDTFEHILKKKNLQNFNLAIGIGLITNRAGISHEITALFWDKLTLKLIEVNPNMTQQEVRFIMRDLITSLVAEPRIVRTRDEILGAKICWNFKLIHRLMDSENMWGVPNTFTNINNGHNYVDYLNVTKELTSC